MKKILPILVLIPILFAGCTTTRTLEDGTVVTEQRNITPAIKAAAVIGTHYALKEHPEWREGFKIAALELKVLESAETLDFATILSIVNRLPVDELKGDDATLIITGATILLTEYGGGVLPLDKLQQFQPIARALREGIELGLGPE